MGMFICNTVRTIRILYISVIHHRTCLKRLYFSDFWIHDLKSFLYPSGKKNVYNKNNSYMGKINLNNCTDEMSAIIFKK